MSSSQQNHVTPPRFIWFRLPLYVRIVIGLAIGLVGGLALGSVYQGPEASASWVLGTTRGLAEVSRILLRLLGAIAPPLVMLAVLKALMTTDIKGKLAGKMIWLLLLNTVVAICIGLLVANVLQPGAHARLGHETMTIKDSSPLHDFLDSIPESLMAPFVSNNVIGIIIIAMAFGFAGRKLPAEMRVKAIDIITMLFDMVIIILHWVLELVPLAVACKVAFIVATQGFKPFGALGWFIVAVIAALVLQACYYLVRVRIYSWVPPLHLLKGVRDALVMSFSTASSTATMPVTYEALNKKVGLRTETASLGALVGSNFNNDGTALYEAMSALFIAQAIGMELSISHQIMVLITSVIAAMGAAGIPEAGLVTMALVFGAVGLPIGYVALLLPIDWFLDRCRTAINVMGDTNVACLLDGKTPGTRLARAVVHHRTHGKHAPPPVEDDVPDESEALDPAV